MNGRTEVLYWHNKGHLHRWKMASELVGVAGLNRRPLRPEAKIAIG